MLARIARRARRDGIRLYAGNNVGYYGPYERLLRLPYGRAQWSGCKAGLSTIGLEADGTIKGCPSLPTRAYASGNIRDRTRADAIRNAAELGFNMTAGSAAAGDDLRGFCATCEHAARCRAGCSWTAHAFFGRRGNNPYCHHRALAHHSRGVRERVLRVAPAPGEPFDHAMFTIVQEPLASPWPANDALRFTPRSIRWPTAWRDQDEPPPPPAGSPNAQSAHAPGPAER